MLVSVAIALVAGLSDCGNDALAGPHSFSADCSLFFFFFVRILFCLEYFCMIFELI